MSWVLFVNDIPTISIFSFIDLVTDIKRLGKDEQNRVAAEKWRTLSQPERESYKKKADQVAQGRCSKWTRSREFLKQVA